MDNGFCTILSKYRIYQGILLCRSLIYNQKKSSIYVLCIDNETYSILSRLNMERVTLINSNQIEDDLLVAIKNQRQLNEYCWTLKPFLIEYILNHFPNLGSVTYIDGDVCFFNDPFPVCNELISSHILLSRHDFLDPHQNVADICGTYNSGYIVFKKSRVSSEALNWWKRQCYEWCFDKAEGGRFGDQKYLDMLSVIIDGVSAIKTPGVNIAPWNDERYGFHVRDGKVYVNGDKLICYHYSGFRIVDHDLFALVLGNRQLIPAVHGPYVHLLKSIINEVNAVSPGFYAFEMEDKFRTMARFFKSAEVGV